MRALVPALVACLLLSGCGDDGDEPRRKSPARTVVAALGDSITAGTPGWDPRADVRDDIPGPDPRSQYGYWAERELPGTDFRNCGVPGERTEEIGLRLEDCAAGADVLIVQGGVNDLAQGGTPDQAARNLRDMVRRGKRLRLRVAIVELLPWNGGYPDAAGPIRRLNRLIHALARAEAVPVIEWYEALEDPRAPGRMRPRLTADLVHPSVAGYRRLGEAVELP
jgi:lysophospholipase L1-like esterase